MSIRPSRQTIRHAAVGAAFLVSAAVLTALAYHYLTVGRYLESTDDSYVKADATIVSPKVQGYVAEVLVRDNQPVEAGQLLARIDDRDFRAALDQAAADVAAAEALIGNLDAQLALQEEVIAEAVADVSAADANLKFAEEEQARYDRLMKSGAGTVQRAQQTDAALRASNAQMQRARSALAAARRKVYVLQTERGRAEAQRDRAKAQSEQAALNLSYTRIISPITGTVGARALRVGQFVQAGTQLMAVVPLEAVYVIANFKETQLTHVRVGQPVEVKIDTFRGTRLRGHVDSLAPASGLEFALLPPDNATGNFTKIVQRVPVKIVLDDTRLAGLLRPGMSAEPTVDTKSAAAAQTQSRNPREPRI